MRSPGGAALPAELTGLRDVLVIAHEWLDVVPCTIAEVDAVGTARIVLVDPRTGEETLGPEPSDADRRWIAAHWPTTTPGDRIEVGLARDEAWADLVTRVDSGLLVAVDYGHTRAERPSGGTLTAYRRGVQGDPVPDGTMDLTAHVAVDSLDADEVGRQRDLLRGLGVLGQTPPHALATSDPLGYLRALERASRRGRAHPARGVRRLLVGGEARRGSGRNLSGMRRVLSVLAVLVVVVLGAPLTASAHDVLETTTPAADSTVERMPQSVSLTFTDAPLSIGTQVVVTGPSGAVQQGAPTIEGRVVTQAISPSAPAGSYTVAYRVTSDDGHPVTGSFAFVATTGLDGSTAAPVAAPRAARCDRVDLRRQRVVPARCRHAVDRRHPRAARDRRLRRPARPGGRPALSRHGGQAVDARLLLERLVEEPAVPERVVEDGEAADRRVVLRLAVDPRTTAAHPLARARRRRRP